MGLDPRGRLYIIRHNYMRIYFIHKIIRQEKGTEVTQELPSDSFDAYKEEYERLEALRDEAENIWEDRTYQMSAGGLSLTFAVFSFLMSGYDGMDFQWPMAVIWGVYAICLLINYLSQHISKYNFLKFQESLSDDRENGLEYDENRLIERYEKTDKGLNVLNVITEVLLILNIVSTVVYTCLLFCSR